MQERLRLAETYLRYWQRILTLQQWQLRVELVEFQRSDGFPQSGDIEVDGAAKVATVKLAQEATGRDRAIILHELLHLLLWEYDHYAEAHLQDEAKDQYFELLESSVAQLTTIFMQLDACQPGACSE